MTGERSQQAMRRDVGRRQGGQALVPVLLVVMILTALAVTLSLAARREAVASVAHLREVQQYYIARGAVVYAAAELQQATNGGTTAPELSLPPDTDANGWTQAGDGWYKVDIVDTTSRVNINTADVATLSKLPALQSDLSIAASIVDWRDADENPTSYQGATGAESDYYQTLTPPYSSKNAPFDTVDELLLVRGITPTLLYGPSTPVSQDPSSVTVITRASRSRQSPGDSAVPPVDTSGSTIPLAELVTTYSRERNVASDGTARVNVQTASQQDLQNQLGISRNVAQSIVTRRGADGSGIPSVAALLGVPGITRQIMQQIGDKVTVSTAQFREGVVNINTAPAEVLAAIPGVDETIYNAVIQARESGTVFAGMNDLFQITSLSATQLQKLVDAVCTKSSVYLLRVRVRMPGTQRVFAAQALVELAAPQTAAASSGSEDSSDASSTAPQILQWREVGRYPGWGTWLAPPTYYNPSGGSIGTP